MTAEVAAGAPPASSDEVRSTTSYARVMENKDVKQKVDEIAAPIQHNYESLMKQLRDRKAVGVVVSANGRTTWADVFASTELLEKYWPKLIRSYASEAVVTRAKGGEVSSSQAGKPFSPTWMAAAKPSKANPASTARKKSTATASKPSP